MYIVLSASDESLICVQMNLLVLNLVKILREPLTILLTKVVIDCPGANYIPFSIRRKGHTIEILLAILTAWRSALWA